MRDLGSLFLSSTNPLTTVAVIVDTWILFSHPVLLGIEVSNTWAVEYAFRSFIYSYLHQLLFGIVIFYQNVIDF